MSDRKRSAPTFAAMEEVSPKKRRTIASALQLRSSEIHHHLTSSHYSLGCFPSITFSPVTSGNSYGTVVSDEFCKDRSPRSSCSSSYVIVTGEVAKEPDSPPVDLELQTKGFKMVDSTTNLNFKSFSLLDEFSGDSEEGTIFSAKTATAASQHRKIKTPPKEEIEEFFAEAERQEQNRFAEKYNFDIARDMPLEGRYQWVRLP